jgi:hypothetical protein
VAADGWKAGVHDGGGGVLGAWVIAVVYG